VVHSIQSHFLPRRDQSLFITKELFKELKGFDENFVIYEDNEIISGFTPKTVCRNS
jgi:predicted glycosyltransferase involved in capsule biosynthesis